MEEEEEHQEGVEAAAWVKVAALVAALEVGCLVGVVGVAVVAEGEVGALEDAG